MPSLREIRLKIKSVKSQQKITKAMKMVAAARMRRAQAAILSARPFAVKMEEAVRHLSALEAAADVRAGREVQIHALFDARPGDRLGLVVVTADKGLCGSFNAAVLRASIDWLRRHSGRPVSVAVVGRKGREFLHRLQDVPMEFAAELTGIFPKVAYAHADLLGKAVLDAYLRDGCSRVDVLYNEFRSAAAQKVVERTLLPIPVPDAGALERREGVQEFKFEPGRELLLEALLPRHLKAQLYRVLLESQAAELAARMNAMDSASKNAGEIIDSLTLGLNRTRQGIITREIAELVGGAEALSS